MDYEIEVIDDEQWMDEHIKIGSPYRKNNKLVKEVWEVLKELKEEKLG